MSVTGHDTARLRQRAFSWTYRVRRRERVRSASMHMAVSCPAASPDARPGRPHTGGLAMNVLGAARDAAAGRSEENERFVAFAFSAAEMLVETDAVGTTTFAAGAFRSRFNRPPESFCGRSVLEMVAPVDHEAVSAALTLLVERGRVTPFTIRLADADRTPLAISGLALANTARPLRLSLSFARLPAPAAGVLRPGAPGGLANAASACLRAGTPADLSLIELLGEYNQPITAGPRLGQALERVAPHAIATEIAPGRFGLLTQGDVPDGLASIAGLLEAALREEGIEAAISTCHLPLPTEGLTPQLAVRALRQALTTFARKGPKGFSDAGFDGGVAGYLRRTASLAASVRAAIAGARFSLAFQPIVALKGRARHHVEALIRPHPVADAPFANPQEFVTLVESLGLAEELDLAVCGMAGQAALRARQCVAFNLSGQSLQSPAFREKLTALLEKSVARKSGLVMIELTETAEIEDLVEATRTAQTLRALGVPFCLDDFGAGTTDVRLLRALSPDIVKLDGSYVPGVARAGRERAFIAGMAEIARAAGARIVAERIETEAEAEALAALDVEFGQGWLFGRPGQLAASPSGPAEAASRVTAPGTT